MGDRFKRFPEMADLTGGRLGLTAQPNVVQQRLGIVSQDAQCPASMRVVGRRCCRSSTWRLNNTWMIAAKGIARIPPASPKTEPKAAIAKRVTMG